MSISVFLYFCISVRAGAPQISPAVEDLSISPGKGVESLLSRTSLITYFIAVICGWGGVKCSAFLD